MMSSDDDFESAVGRLADVWTHISNLQLALNCSLTGPLKSNPHAKRMQTVLEDMGVLIDESMQMADDLFTMTRKSLAESKEKKNESSTDPLEMVCPSCKQKQSVSSQVDTWGADLVTGQLTAGSLDQYLALMRPKPTPQPTKTSSAMEMFDLMAQKPREEKSTATSTTLKSSTIEKHVTFKSTKSAQEEINKSFATKSHKKSKTKSKKRTRRVSPYAPHEPATQPRPSEKPLCICDWHGRTIQREYAFMYEGLSEPIWTAPRHATDEELKLICKFKAETRRRKPRDGSEEDTQAKDGGGVQQPGPGKLYSVDKIVGHRTNKLGKKEYVVKWDGYDSSENTWEPAAKLRAEVPRVVDAYERGLAVEASRRAIGSALAGGKPKHEPRSSGDTVIAKPRPSAMEDAVYVARGITSEAFSCEEEEEDSEIERMAASDRGEGDSDSDASE